MEMLYEYEIEEDSSIGNNPEEDLEMLLNEIEQRTSDIDQELVRKAFDLCLEYHGTQVRASGRPYYLHPLKVALILIQEINAFDTASVVGALLHDSIEDVEGETNEEKEFEREKLRLRIQFEFGKDDPKKGKEILEIVEALTKIKHEKTFIEQDKAATYRKLFLALVKDVRVILIKLADRLHNMRTLHYLKPRKQQDIGKETLNFYTPFAHRLGLTRVKMEMEDRSLYYTDRATYEAIRTALAEKRRDFVQYIRFLYEELTTKLNEEGVKHVLTVVHKHIYEIFQMVESGKPLNEIDNFYSMVVTTDSNDKFECYKAHGILVNNFNPVGRMVDNISQPKINFYQSLKSKLFGPDGKLIEVIIRTGDMEKHSDEGIAKEFSFQQGRLRALEITDADIELWGKWMEDVIDIKGEQAAQMIWDSIRNNLFDAEVSVFTPDGKLHKLPAKSCPIDFAFHLSPDTGLHCISCKVNGKIMELNYELKNGDIVEIISSPNQKPNPEWQDIVISHKAEAYLHKYFLENPPSDIEVEIEKTNYDVKLMIRGDDANGMLQLITEAIGKTSIKRVSLDSSDNDFGGAIMLTVRDDAHLNSIFAKLFGIKGIKSVEKSEEL